MFILNNSKYIESPFESEDEIKEVVFDHFEEIFGPNTFYLPKSIIKDFEGTGTIPDCYAINIPERSWYIVGCNLLRNGVWQHLAKQTAKQIISTQQFTTRKILLVAMDQLTENDQINEMFIDEGVPEIDIIHVLNDILRDDPTIGIPIDEINNDLRDWAISLALDVRIWILKKYVEFGNEKNVIYDLPEECRPEFETKKEKYFNERKEPITKYDVSILDLINENYLQIGEDLLMAYKGTTFIGTIQEDGSIMTLGKKINSPNYAALSVIQSLGSNRRVTNGWKSWKTKSAVSLHELRERFLEEKEIAYSNRTNSF